MKEKNLYIWIILFIMAALPVYPESRALPVVIDGTEEQYVIGRNLEILEDKAGILSFREVSSPELSGRFTRSLRDIPNYCLSKSVFWVRFRVTFPPYKKSCGRSWFIKCGWPHLTSVTAFLSEPDGSYRIAASGSSCPASSREIPYKAYAFRLTSQPGKTVSAYIRIQTSGAMILPFSVSSERKLLSEMKTENIVTGVFLGVMFIMIFYYLLLYFAVKDKDYLYFILFLFANILFYVINEGMFEEYVRIGSAMIRAVLMSLTAAAAAVTATLFTVHMLNLRKDLPAAAKMFYGFIFLYILAAILTFFLPETYVWSSFFILSIIQDFIIVVVAFIRLAQRYGIAFYFLIISVLSLTSNASYMLARFDLIQPGIFTGNILLFFTIVQAFILSYAISIRIKKIERERIDAQALAIENLKTAERIKDEFLANTSHELKTPLHGIVGLSDLMLKAGKDKYDDRTRENLSLISGGGRRLMSLVNDILDFSSIRNGSMSLRMKSVDLRRTVSAVFALLRPLTEGKAIELRNSIPADFSAVYADEERLRQIFTNLAGNALKFTPFGVVDISAVIDNDGMAKICVCDTGVGIKSEDMDRIFSSFEQGEITESRSYGGAGLGLAITKKLVELQGGTITVESRPGMGSTFMFTLPCSDVNQKAGTQEPAEIFQGEAPAYANDFYDGSEGEASGTSVTLDKGRPTILVVEDDPISRRILSDYLSLTEYNVLTAPNGTSVIEKLGTGSHPDLILLDIMMPGLSGYDVLGKIRQSLSPEELPVILITAKSQLDDINRGFEAGANDYIIKPFSMEELSRRVENMLKLKNVLLPVEPGLMIKEKGKSKIIQYKDIIYLSSAGKKTVVHATERDEESFLKLREFEQKLPGSFIRIHRQCILNTAFLVSVSHLGSGRYEAVLNDADDTRLVVSRMCMANLREFLNRNGFGGL